MIWLGRESVQNVARTGKWGGSHSTPQYSVSYEIYAAIFAALSASHSRFLKCTTLYVHCTYMIIRLSFSKINVQRGGIQQPPYSQVPEGIVPQLHTPKDVVSQDLHPVQCRVGCTGCTPYCTSCTSCTSSLIGGNSLLCSQYNRTDMKKENDHSTYISFC